MFHLNGPLIVFLVVIIGFASIPTLVLFTEVVGALVARNEEQSATIEVAAGRVVVVVPAHNESHGIIPTLEDIAIQLKERDRLIVVADNCSDDTADVSAAHGAEVLARDQPDRRGKGYAMAWAIAHLKEDPPDFVLFVDADCRLQPNFIATALSYCCQVNRPVQALYLMTGANTSQANQRVAEFAWRLKNWVRPLGLSYFRRPVQLMGSGMVFPWGVIKVCAAGERQHRRGFETRPRSSDVRRPSAISALGQRDERIRDNGARRRKPAAALDSGTFGHDRRVCPAVADGVCCEAEFRSRGVGARSTSTAAFLARIASGRNAGSRRLRSLCWVVCCCLRSWRFSISACWQCPSR